MGEDLPGLDLGFDHQPPQKLIRTDAFPNSATVYPFVGSQGLAAVPFATPAYPLFTPAQWQELHRQALIYKHLLSSAPIPIDLLFGSGSFAPPYPEMSVGAGGGNPNLRYFAGASADPEPWRCRRTDGKKWRCSKDAAPDQKYCERHLNRGRTRSRKPVERSTAPVPRKPEEPSGRYPNLMGGIQYPPSAKLPPPALALSMDPAGWRSAASPAGVTGGPLAEALQTRAEAPSPTGVLQRGALLSSLSDSSGGSSPTFVGARRTEMCLL